MEKETAQEKTEAILYLKAYAENVRQRLGRDRPVSLSTLLRMVARDGRALDSLLRHETADVRDILLLAALREIQQNQGKSNGLTLLAHVLKRGIEHGYWKRKELPSNGTEPTTEDVLPIQIGDFFFDPLKRLVQRADMPAVHLQPRLASLFNLFAHQPNQIITPGMIGRAWDLQTYQDTESFRALCWTQIGCLKKVVGDQEIEKHYRRFRYINNIAKRGYIFDPSGEGKIDVVHPHQ